MVTVLAFKFWTGCMRKANSSNVQCNLSLCALHTIDSFPGYVYSQFQFQLFTRRSLPWQISCCVQLRDSNLSVYQLHDASLWSLLHHQLYKYIQVYVISQYASRVLVKSLQQYRYCLEIKSTYNSQHICRAILQFDRISKAKATLNV